MVDMQKVSVQPLFGNCDACPNPLRSFRRIRTRSSSRPQLQKESQSRCEAKEAFQNPKLVRVRQEDKNDAEALYVRQPAVILHFSAKVQLSTCQQVTGPFSERKTSVVMVWKWQLVSRKVDGSGYESAEMAGLFPTATVARKGSMQRTSVGCGIQRRRCHGVLSFASRSRRIEKSNYWPKSACRSISGWMLDIAVLSKRNWIRAEHCSLHFSYLHIYRVTGDGMSIGMDWKLCVCRAFHITRNYK